MSTDRIPTLDAWLQEFVGDPRLDLIWLDVKVTEEKLLPLFVRQLKTLLQKYGVSSSQSQSKLIVRSKEVATSVAIYFRFFQSKLFCREENKK